MMSGRSRMQAALVAAGLFQLGQAETFGDASRSALPTESRRLRRLNTASGGCPLSNTDILIPVPYGYTPELVPELLASIETNVPCYNDIIVVSAAEKSELGFDLPLYVKNFVLKPHEKEVVTAERMILLADKFTSADHVFVMQPGKVFTEWQDGCFFDETGKSRVFCSSFDDGGDSRYRDGTEYMLSRTVQHDCSDTAPTVYPRDVFLETRMWIESMHGVHFHQVMEQVGLEGEKKLISSRDVINHYMLKFMDRVTVPVDQSNLRWRYKDSCTKVSDLAPSVVDSYCPAIDYAALQKACPFRDIDCVTVQLWDQRPLPYVASDEEVQQNAGEYWWIRARRVIGDDELPKLTAMGEEAFKVELDYHAIGDDLSANKEGWSGNLPAVDQHRTFVLTQPKVGTGSLWYGAMPMSDFMVRTHNVIGLLQSEMSPIPFPGCKAKPEGGKCSIMLGIRDPKTWLKSMYFELNGNQECDMAPEDPVKDWYDWMQRSIDVHHDLPMGWWKASEQLRTLGVSEEKIIDVFRGMVQNEGVRILSSDELPGLPVWMEGCNVVLVQMEKMKSGSSAERIIQEQISGKFKFRTDDKVVTRADLCPGLTDAIKQVKRAPIPQRIVRQYAKINPDFGDMWQVYHGEIEQKGYAPSLQV